MSGQKYRLYFRVACNFVGIIQKWRNTNSQIPERTLCKDNTIFFTLKVKLKDTGISKLQRRGGGKTTNKKMKSFFKVIFFYQNWRLITPFLLSSAMSYVIITHIHFPLIAKNKPWWAWMKAEQQRYSAIGSISKC